MNGMHVKINKIYFQPKLISTFPYSSILIENQKVIFILNKHKGLIK